MAVRREETRANASNLPPSTGPIAVSKTGTIETLVPILALRRSIQNLDETNRTGKQRLAVDPNLLPVTEQSFKRLLDVYSDPVSYKQKFLDQNAFLVYYTKGFDGPGRPSMEATDSVENERQTLQFGYRNEAWVSWDAFLTELAFQEDTDNDIDKYLRATLVALDAYLSLIPPEQVNEATSFLLQ